MGKHKGMPNPELHAAMMDLRRSSAASPHDSRPKRERARREGKRAAIRRSSED